MKKEHIPCYISILSLIVSGIAIGVSCYRTEELSMDYMGMIVGILSLLVTALLGWNIYSVIDVKNIRQDYEELKAKLNASIEEQNAEKTRLRKYVNIVQSFTMANVRLTEKKYGDALGLYCDSAIGLNRMRNEYGLNRNDEEFELMNKCINMANTIIRDGADISNSDILRDRHQDIIEGLKGITNRRTKEIETYIEATYNQDDTTSNSK